MHIELEMIVYLTAVAFTGLGTIALLRWRFRRAESQRKERVEELRQFVAVATASRERDKAEAGKEMALESIETRFSMMRRLLTPLVLVAMGLLMAAPFLSRAPATLVSLLVTALTVVLGIAAKPVLENGIAGILISYTQPIRIGDVVRISGHYGLVENIFLTYTVIKVWDWRRFIIPNHRLLQMEYENYSLHDRWQWAYVPFWVDHSADMELLETLADQAVRSSAHHLDGRPIGFWIIEVGQQGVQCWVAGWAEDPIVAWSLRHDIAKALLRLCAEHGIKAHTYHVQTAPAAVVAL